MEQAVFGGCSTEYKYKAGAKCFYPARPPSPILDIMTSFPRQVPDLLSTLCSVSRVSADQGQPELTL
jgi:hypothetical protein